MTDTTELTREQIENLLHAAESACDDLNVQCRFWRQAAEHAVEGWNKLEDKIEHAVQILGGTFDAEAPEPAVVSQLGAIFSGEAPPSTIDLGEGVTLRVVETETPIPEK